MAKLVIFTDLDGTLLNPCTYSFDEALPALCWRKGVEGLRQKKL